MTEKQIKDFKRGFLGNKDPNPPGWWNKIVEFFTAPGNWIADKILENKEEDQYKPKEPSSIPEAVESFANKPKYATEEKRIQAEMAKKEAEGKAPEEAPGGRGKSKDEGLLNEYGEHLKKQGKEFDPEKVTMGELLAWRAKRLMGVR